MVLDCAKKVAVVFQKIDVAKITNNFDTEDKYCQKKKIIKWSRIIVMYFCRAQGGSARQQTGI